MAFEQREHNAGHGGGFQPEFAIRRTRRPVTDYGSSTVQWMRHRRRDRTKIEQERPSHSYVIDMIPPAARVDRPGDTIPVKHLHSSLNKIKHPINVVKWTPEGRRLLTGSTSGEFTLWNGMGFNFETIMSAHESAIRAVAWSHSDDWLVSADQEGIVKYWQPNFNNVKAIQAHEAPVRDIAFSPTDAKYVTGSDDASLKIWDFSSGTEESTLTGHGWDVKAVDWHPTKGLLVSGSKDHVIKLWDPRTGRCLTNLHGHKNTISKTSFEPTNGLLLATCARDQIARVFDLRMMRDVLLLRGHEKELTTLTWHPVHSSLLSTGAADGSIYHYLLDEPNLPAGSAPTVSPYDTPDPPNAPAQTIYPAHKISFAHEMHVWSLSWHPLGHILASGSNDRVTRFWTRARPGETDCFNDRYHLGDAAAKAHGSWTSRGPRHAAREEEDQEVEDEAEALVDQKVPLRETVLPGLPGIAGLSNGAGSHPKLPGMGDALPLGPPRPAPSAPHLLGLPPVPAGIDPTRMPDISKLAELFGGRVPPPPIPGAGAPGQLPPPPPPGFSAFANSALPPPGTLPSNYPPPPQSYAPPGIGFNAEMNGQGDPGSTKEGNTGGGLKKRAPLPSQRDSLRQEMRKGNFRKQSDR